MRTKIPFTLQPSPHPSRRLCIKAIQEAPDGWCVTIQEPTRTLEQNSAQWPLLTMISKSRQWPVNGVMETLTPDEWKVILTAAFKRESMRVAQGYDGGMVLLGARTRDFRKKEFSDWLEFPHMVCADFGLEGVA